MNQNPSMIQTTIHEAKTHLSRYIRLALEGEEVIIAKGKQPLVKLQCLFPTGQKRRLGGAAGLIVEMSDDFDSPLEDFNEYS